MADDDVQRLVVNIEARLANYEKQLNKALGITNATMKGVSASVDKGMRDAEKRAAASAARINGALKQSLSGIKGELLSSVSGLNGRIGLLTNTLGALGPAGAGAAIGLGSLVAVFATLYVKGKDALKAADDIGDAADKLGVSAESLQELRAVFNGLVDPAQVDAGLGALTEQIGLASAGVPKAAKVFKALGIDIRDSNGNVKTGLPVYLELADKIASLKSPAQQAAAAQKALGDSGKEQLPILRQGSAAIKEQIDRYRAMGAIISNETIAKAGALQQQLDDLALVVRAQLTTALVDAGPAIVKLTQWFAEHLPQAIEIATKAVKFLADNMETLVAIFGALTGAAVGGNFGPLGALIGAATGAGAALAAFNAIAESGKDTIESLAAKDPAVRAFLDAVNKGGVAAAGGLDAMSASARQAVIELAKLQIAQGRATNEPIFAQIDKNIGTFQGLPPTEGGGAENTAQFKEASRQLLIIQQQYKSGAIDFAAAKEQADGLINAMPMWSQRTKELAISTAGLRAQTIPTIKAMDEWFQIQEKAEAEQAKGSLIPNRPDVRATGELGDMGAGGGKAKKEPAAKDSKLAEYLAQLQVEVDRLALSGIALKENQLLTEALAKAKEDFKNKLRGSAELTMAETEAISAQAKTLAGVPDILGIAKDKLPQFNLATQMKQLTELQGLLKDPSVVAALQAQGLSAEDAGKAIQAQIAQVKDQANGTTEAITGIGDAFQNGIQGATSFADAVMKISIALGQMALQAALFGKTSAGGPLGGVFDNLLGTVGGLLGGLGGLGGGAGATGTVAGVGLGAAGLIPHAGGGPMRGGAAYSVNELGREAVRRNQDIFIPGKAATMLPADATKRAYAGPANSNSQPIQFNISMAGANGDQTIRTIAAQAVAQGLKSVPEINRQHTIRFAQ